MFDDSTIQQLAEIYQNQCGVVDTNEFRDEVLRFVYISRLLRRYDNGGKINMRLLINHMIVVHNVFDIVATKLLIDYIDSDLHPQLFAVLDLFSRLPTECDRSKIDYDMVEQLHQEINDDG